VTGACVFLPLLFGAFAASRQDCVACHRMQALSQPATSMGHALENVASCEILRAYPKLEVQVGSYSYQIAREGDRSLYTVTNGKDTIATPIAWAFGLGSAGQTYVYQWKGGWYESRVSFYKQLHGLDLTMGATNTIPHNIEEAAGRLMYLKEAGECFNCHATNALHGGQVDTDRLTPGVMCERCHGPSDKHIAALKSGRVQEAAMPHLEKMHTEEISDFCGECHRTWSQITKDGPHNINNVRFQPYRLTNSKCYDTSDPRISCVACHDPHREVERATAYYDCKCLACHAGGQTSLAGSIGRAKPCRAATKGCVTCHMPTYEIPGLHNLFTDHQIRIVKPGEPYPE
jgi:hypothetical protein